MYKTWGMSHHQLCINKEAHRHLDQKGLCIKYYDLFFAIFCLTIPTTDNVPQVLMTDSKLARINDTVEYRLESEVFKTPEPEQPEPQTQTQTETETETGKDNGTEGTEAREPAGEEEEVAPPKKKRKVKGGKIKKDAGGPPAAPAAEEEEEEKPKDAEKKAKEDNAAKVGLNKFDLIELGIAEMRKLIEQEKIPLKLDVIAMIRRRLAEFVLRDSAMQVGGIGGKPGKELKTVADAVKHFKVIGLELHQVHVSYSLNLNSWSGPPHSGPRHYGPPHWDRWLIPY